ncbi:MAG: family 2 glycosyl transferase, partial [Anaerolineae bacterium]|nr:family 2 glycosyl transferase [Anaerolineae bacterium]
MWLSAILLLLTAASWVYWLIALVLVRAHFGRKDEPEGSPDFMPPVSILKPVKGVDFEAFENFASF